MAARARADFKAGKIKFTEEEKKHIEKWNNIGQISTFLIAVAIASPFVIQKLSIDPRTSLSIGIGIVVAVGATGQVLRGLGERFPKYGSALKAYGYYCGAGAYIATASVALANGLPKLLGL